MFKTLERAVPNFPAVIYFQSFRMSNFGKYAPWGHVSSTSSDHAPSRTDQHYGGHTLPRGLNTYDINALYLLCLYLSRPKVSSTSRLICSSVAGRQSAKPRKYNLIDFLV